MARCPRYGSSRCEHAGVVGPSLASQGKGHEVGQVEVADADGIRVTERADRDFRRRPWTDAGDGHERGRSRVMVEVREALHPRCPGGQRADQLGSALLDAERVVGVVRQGRQPLGLWRQSQAGPVRARGVLAVRPDEALPGASRFIAGDLLLEDGRDERIEDGAAPGDADPRMRSRERIDQATGPARDVGGRRAPRRRSDQIRDSFECLRRRRGPRLRPGSARAASGRRPSLDRPPSGPSTTPVGDAAGWSDRPARARADGGSRRGRSVAQAGRRAVASGGVCHGFDMVTVRVETLRNRRSVLRSLRRATPQGRREHGAHRHPRRGRRPRTSRFAGPQPVRIACR